ncbi:hypothetical protein GCM10023196_007740 [Actinoallomurus vinaceus]|uniref:Uncharacterized protein n=1 Tax=Actinoallomurus vinaceus TaxID=1080074 RepID=A0ABP8U2I6_9ACTN
MSVPVSAIAAMTSHRMRTIAISPGRVPARRAVPTTDLPPVRRAPPSAGLRSGRPPPRRPIRITDLRSFPVEDGSPPPAVVVSVRTGGIGAGGGAIGGSGRVAPPGAGVGRVPVALAPPACAVADEVERAAPVSTPPSADRAGRVTPVSAPPVDAGAGGDGGIGRVVPASAPSAGSEGCPCGEAGRRADR